MIGSAHRALILARGAGSRMQAGDTSASLTADQLAAASAGQKAFMPIGGRPFLAYLLDALASAGIRDVGLVVPPGREVPPEVTPVIQKFPRGTADAVSAARDWAGEAPFLVLNGDNLYPVAAIKAVATLDGPGLAGFDRNDLVQTSNIPAERIAAFAVIERDARGNLQRIVEKPKREDFAHLRRPILVSMNLWRFDAHIFDACRDVAPSARGELELPSAVMLARDRGVTFAVVPAVGPVLDLSHRADVADIARRLGVEP